MTRVLTQPPSLLVSLLHLVLCHPLTGVQCLYPKNVPNKRLQLRSVQQRKKARARTMEIRHRQLAFNRRATLDQVGKRQCGTEADAKGRLRNTIHQDESELPAPDSEDESPALGSEDDDIEVVTGMLDAMVIDAGVETEISDGDPDIASPTFTISASSVLLHTCMFLFHLDAESAKLGFVLGYAEDVVGCKVYFPEERMAKFVSDLRVAKDVVYRDRHSVSIEDADLESLPFKRSENGIEAECSMDSDDIDEIITELNLFETTVEAPNVNEFESL
ncbi:hypothetical protein PR001_g498 [Phytophthora rubi]|uniref:Uncharacterized protein n=1 Tax=Phytophthora rubi TaxID=129364 RepID=A0A6A3P6E6_9STRA|nr:hypothetical protein PR001_g498 [Phytophthora rubi]